MDRYLPGRYIEEKGNKTLYFGGTAYLGLPVHPGYQELVREGTQRYGAHFGSTRRSTIAPDIFAEAEHKLARWLGAESSLLLSSGTLAGQLLVRSLSAQTSHFFYAPKAHPALWNQAGNPAPDLSFKDWTVWMCEQLQQLKQPAVLLSNVSDPLFAETLSFDWVADLPAHAPITLVIDDSHGLGVTGPHGGGSFSNIPVPAHVQVVGIASLGKGLGTPGGIVYGPAVITEQLRSTASFGGASPPPAPYLYALVHSPGIQARQRQRLQQYLTQLDQVNRRYPLFRHAPGYPVFYTARHEMGPALLKRAIHLSQFNYPSPESPLLTRAVISAHHEPEDIEALIAGITYFAQLM